MMLTITTSGGIGSFGLGRSVRVEVDSLPSELKSETCERLAPEALKALSTQTPQGADRIVYKIAVDQVGKERVTFDLPENALSAAMLDLIDKLMEQGGSR